MVAIIIGMLGAFNLAGIVRSMKAVIIREQHKGTTR